MSHSRYIQASELNTYLFCKRAWHLSQRGAASSLEPERAAGLDFLHNHGDQVRDARRASTLATLFAVAGVVLLCVFLWLVLR